MNDAHRLVPFADVLYTSDLRWLRHHDGVPTFGGMKVSIEQAPGRGAREHARWPDWTVLRNTGDRGVEADPSGLRTGRNSGAAAINLAVHLGAERILLLGYDMGLSPSGSSHFFGQHPPLLRSLSPYTAFAAMFAAMADPLRALGLTVINCSRSTSLSCFPCADLLEALA